LVIGNSVASGSETRYIPLVAASEKGNSPNLIPLCGIGGCKEMTFGAPSLASLGLVKDLWEENI